MYRRIAMEVEKEVRYLVDDNIWNSVLLGTTEYKPKSQMLDITMGKYGLDSFQKTGLVFRVRQKGEKISMEIKKRVGESEWLEESIPLDSVGRGVSYLKLAGLSPYLYISRTREVKKFKGLKIFLDDVEMLGKFIEIEYQDSDNAKAELNEFLQTFGIENNPQDLYGTIIIRKYNEDENFRNAFNSKMNEIVNNIN